MNTYPISRRTLIQGSLAVTAGLMCPSVLRAKTFQPVIIAAAVTPLTNPHKFYVSNQAWYAGQVVQPLIRNGHGNTVEGVLATDWTHSPDCRIWTIRIRPNVTWHSGRLFTNKDAAANLAVILPDEPEISLVGEDKVEVRLKTPNALFPSLLAEYSAVMLDPERGFAFEPGNANGTGPYELVDWVANSHVTIQKRTTPFWGEFQPEIPTFTYRDFGIGSIQQEVDLLVKGDIDLNLSFSALVAEQLPPQFELIQGRKADTAVLEMLAAVTDAQGTVQPTPYADPNFRRAIRNLVDADELLNSGEVLPAIYATRRHNDLVCRGVHKDCAPLPLFTAQLSEAERYLRLAGCSPDSPVALTIHYRSKPLWEGNLAKAMSKRLTRPDLGLTCTAILVEDENEFWAGWGKTYPCAVVGWAHRVYAPQVASLSCLTGGKWNVSGFSDPDFDTALTHAMEEPDPDRRSGLMKKSQERLQDIGPIAELVGAERCLTTTSGRIDIASVLMTPTGFTAVERLRLTA